MKVQEIGHTEDYPQRKAAAKKKKKDKKRLRWLKFILLLALFTATVVLLAQSQLFEIKSLQVTGSDKYKQEDIIQTTGLTVGMNGFKAIGSNVGNILLLRYGKAEQDIVKRFPYIKEAKVQFALPNKIRISLVERIPSAIVSNNGTSILIDAEAVALEVLQPGSKVRLPVIKGLKFPNCELGHPLKLENPDGFKSADKLLKVLKETDFDGKSSLADIVTYVEAGDPAKMSVNFESRITVKLGDLKELKYRLDFFKTIYFKNLKKDEKGTIDFTTGENPSFRPDK